MAKTLEQAVDIASKNAKKDEIVLFDEQEYNEEDKFKRTPMFV